MQIQSSDVPLTSTICAHARKVGGEGGGRGEGNLYIGRMKV